MAAIDDLGMIFCSEIPALIMIGMKM